MTFWVVVGGGVVLFGALKLWSIPVTRRHERERAGWRVLTGRIVRTEVIKEEGGRSLQPYVEYVDDDGVIVGFMNARSVSERIPFGRTVDIRVDPGNKYRGIIVSKPFAPPVLGPLWWETTTGILVLGAGVLVIVLALM